MQKALTQLLAEFRLHKLSLLSSLLASPLANVSKAMGELALILQYK